jgi:hypothetical protein
MNRINVAYDSSGITLAGHLYVPDGPADGPGPAIVVGHPAVAELTRFFAETLETEPGV